MGGLKNGLSARMRLSDVKKPVNKGPYSTKKFKGKSQEECRHVLESLDSVNQELAYTARQALNWFELQKEEKLSKRDLYKLNKAQQITKLRELGLSNEEIIVLKSEKERVDKLYLLL